MNELFAAIFEGWGWFRLGDFSNDLYNNLLYTPIGIIMVATSITWMVIYYYVIDHPRFSRPWHWLIWILILCAINFAASNYITSWKLTELYTSLEKDVPYYSEFTTFSIVVAVWTYVFAFMISLLIKRKSVMCKRTPF